MTKSKQQQRYGVFYRSNGRWTGPYQGATFTKYTLGRNPVKSNIRRWANSVLKSAIKLAPVG
jgi:hypothetical protein